MASAVISEGIGKTQQNIIYSMWDDWSPKNYLQTYFSKLGPDTTKNLQFLQTQLQRYLGTKIVPRILDFGCGPTIFAGLLASIYANEIHMCDYLSRNLKEINKWLKSDLSAFDWQPCLEEILKLQEIPINIGSIMARETVFKTKATKLLLCDAYLPNPLINYEKKYPIVITNFCADSATSSKETWQLFMKNILSLVEDKGMILIAALRNCSFYRVSNQLFPCANINENDLQEILIKEGFQQKNTYLEIHEVPECSHEGFESIMFAKSLKTR